MTDVMAHEDVLSRTDFFADAPPDALASVAAAGQERHLIRGDVLFNEGDPPDALYLVLRGRMAIAIANPIDRRESVVALMEPDDLFGEMSMLDNGPRSAMARALEPTTVLAIPFEPILAMFDEHPVIAGQIRLTFAAVDDDPVDRSRGTEFRIDWKHPTAHAEQPGATCDLYNLFGCKLVRTVVDSPRRP